MAYTNDLISDFFASSSMMTDARMSDLFYFGSDTSQALQKGEAFLPALQISASNLKKNPRGKEALKWAEKLSVFMI